MPPTTTAAEAAENTLSRIQQDIMENSRREKELHEQYRYRYGTEHPGSQRAEVSEGDEEEAAAVPPKANGFTTMMNGTTNKPAKSNWTPLLRAISSSSLVTPDPQQNGTFRAFSSVPYQRRIGSSGGVRGVMEKFIKSRGKIAQVKALPMNGFSTNGLQTQHAAIPDVDMTTRITIDPTKRKFVRNNFVPIEERMKREFQEMHSREKELNAHRKSMSSLNLNEIGLDEDFDDDVNNEPNNQHDTEDTYPMSNGMKSARSMGELYMTVNNGHHQHRERGYDSEDELDERYDREEPSNSLGKNRQMAKSLAELCDAPEEELFTPGPQAVIMQFENMIRKNQQNRA